MFKVKLIVTETEGDGLAVGFEPVDDRFARAECDSNAGYLVLKQGFEVGYDSEDDHGPSCKVAQEARDYAHGIAMETGLFIVEETIAIGDVMPGKTCPHCGKTGKPLQPSESLAFNERKCRVCGCTQEKACLDEGRVPCHWIAEDLCSSCVGKEGDTDNVQ